MTKLKLLQRDIKKTLKAAHCMDLYGSDDFQRLQVIRQVLTDYNELRERVRERVSRIKAICEEGD